MDIDFKIEIVLQMLVETENINWKNCVNVM